MTSVSLIHAYNFFLSHCLSTVSDSLNLNFNMDYISAHTYVRILALFRRQTAGRSSRGWRLARQMSRDLINMKDLCWRRGNGHWRDGTRSERLLLMYYQTLTHFTHLYVYKINHWRNFLSIKIKQTRRLINGGFVLFLSVVIIHHYLLLDWSKEKEIFPFAYSSQFSLLTRCNIGLQKLLQNPCQISKIFVGCIQSLLELTLVRR